MADTCLACDNDVPRWSGYCDEHVWMASVQVDLDEAMADVQGGELQAAARMLEAVAERIRREGEDG